MKKQLLRVLAVILTVILLLTCVTSTAYAWGYPVEVKLDMYHYSGSEPMSCGPCSGVSIGQYYREVVDRDGDGGDVIIEDFEWGNDGTSLDTSGGEVEWTLTKMGWGGSPVAEISTDYAHLGDSSARFYRDGWLGYMQASYTEAPPTWRKFYFYFEEGSDAVLYTTNGDGDHRIFVRVIIEDGEVQYYDGSWKVACNLRHFPPPPTEGGWNCIEFRNINWIDATYEIYVNGYDVLGGNPAHMHEATGYNGMTAYYNAGGVGSEFWIDDILDTRTGADYPALPDDDAMYHRLIDCMNTSETYGTWIVYYGSGFVEMTEECGYSNFSRVNDFFNVDDDDEDNDGLADDLEDIMEAIDNGWPIALGGGFKNVDEMWTDGDPEKWPPKKGHYIAIRGYGYYQFLSWTWGYYIICTDSLSKSNELKLNWDNLISNGGFLRTVTIKDN